MSPPLLLAGFNAEPACTGVGPTGTPDWDFRIATLVVYVLVALFILVTSVWFIAVRQFRRRLFIRSLNPIVLGSLGSAICLLIRAGYNYVGREHLSCTGNLALIYCFFILNIVTENMFVASFMVKQGFRARFTNIALVAATKEHKHQDAKIANTSRMASSRAISDVDLPYYSQSQTGHSSSIAHDQAGIWRYPMRLWIALGLKEVATPAKWFRGFWNYFLTMFDAVAIYSGTVLVFTHAKFRFKSEDNKFVSPIRELSYEMLTTIFMASALFIAFGFRAGFTPVYQAGNHCTGCTLFWEDAVILLGTLGIMASVMNLVIVRTKDIPDPLRYRMDLLVAMSFATIAWIGYILAIVDPGNLMKQQKVDWFVFEGIAALILHWRRCITQLRRVLVFHNKRQLDLKLIDILQGDPRGALLFEKHAMGELASENLLFWREGVKYKTNFGKDFDYSQQQAKVLFRTFIAKHAQLPINISGELREAIESRFRSGVVGRNVFDEALVEIYQMMQNGCFERFVRSKAFREYAKSKADFSLPVSSAAAAQLQVVPSPSPLATPHSSSLGQHHQDFASDAGAGSGNRTSAQRELFSVYEYIRTLS